VARLEQGQRVCYQSWEGQRPHRAERGDRGTAVVVAPGCVEVHWDTGEVDQVTPIGWCASYAYRALPLGAVPDVAPSPELVASWWSSPP